MISELCARELSAGNLRTMNGEGTQNMRTTSGVLRSWLAPLVLFWLLTALLTHGSVQSAPVVVRFGTTNSTWPGWLEYLSWAKEVFEAKNPGTKIEIIDVARSSMSQVPLTSLDVLDLPFQQAGLLARLGILADLSSLLREADLDRFLPILHQYTRSGQPLFGLPIWVNPTIILYRHGDDLQQAIYRLTAPVIGSSRWSWDALGNFAVKLTRHQNDDRIPELAGFEAYWHFLDIAYHQLGDLYDRSGSAVRINSSVFTFATSYVLHWYLAVDRPFTYPVPFGNEDQEWFIQGKAVMRLGTARDLWELSGMALDQYELLPLPKGPDTPPAIRHPQARSGSKIGLASLQLVASSPRRSEAWRWISFLALDRDAAMRRMTMTRTVPALREILPLYVRYVPGPASLFSLVEEVENPDAALPDLIPQEALLVQTRNSLLRSAFDWAPQGPRASHPPADIVARRLDEVRAQLEKILSGEASTKG